MVAAGYEGGLHKLCSHETQRRLSSTRALPSRMASRTPLFEWHRAAGARFIEFGGWEMPLQYSGIVDEHLTVRQAVGLFDVSHMGKIFVEGPTAHAFLDRFSANDVPTSSARARFHRKSRGGGSRVHQASPSRPHGTPPLPVDGPRFSSHERGTQERRDSSSFRHRPRDGGSGNRS